MVSKVTLPSAKQMIDFMKKTKANVGFFSDNHWYIETELSSSMSKRLEFAFREAMLDHGIEI